MTDHAENPQSTGDRTFRRVLGYLCIFGALAGFAGLYFIEVPEANDKAMMFALGIIFQWGSNVVSSEYGVTTTGRKVAESAVRAIERQEQVAASSPAGTAEDPISVAGATDDAEPVKTKDAKP